MLGDCDKKRVASVQLVPRLGDAVGVPGVSANVTTSAGDKQAVAAQTLLSYLKGQQRGKEKVVTDPGSAHPRVCSVSGRLCPST